MRVMGRAFAARIFAFPISALAGFATTALIIRVAGAEMYGVIMVVASMFMLMPFADLGTGAVIVNSFSEPGSTRESRTRVAAKVFRVLLASAMTIAAIAWLGTTIWSWGDLLGIASLSSRADVVTAVSVTLFAVSIPPSIGIRMLVGSGRATLSILMAPIGSVVALLVATAIVTLQFDPIWFTLTMPSGVLVAQCLSLTVGLRVSSLSWRDLVSPTDFPTRSVVASSVPMFVIMLTLPLALNSHRIILSQLSTPSDLARYSLAMQFYQPLWSFISAAATPLWPLWASMRDRPSAINAGFTRTICALGLLGLSSLVGLVLFGDWLGGLISGKTIHLGVPLLAVTGLLLFVQALQQAPGMFLTSPAGLRFQSYGAAGATVASLTGSVILSPHLGALAPSMVTAAGILVAQTIPGLILARRQLTAERPSEAALTQERSLREAAD